MTMLKIKIIPATLSWISIQLMVECDPLRPASSQIVQNRKSRQAGEKTSGQRKGVGGLFVKSLAVCLLQAKNTTLPGLQQSLEEWGGGHACVSVAPYPAAGGWKSRRRTVQPCWGMTGGQTGMWFSVCTVLTVCLAKGVHEPQLSAAVTHV